MLLLTPWLTKIPVQTKDPMLIETNAKHIQNMQALREHWICPKAQPSCTGMHCYIDFDNNHIPLSHERLECWATAMLKGEASATLHQPPNHRLFDAHQPLSPVLQQRLKANKMNEPPVNAAPIFNLSFGNEIAKLLTNTGLLGTPAATTAPNVPFSLTLISLTRKPGNDMPLAEFCVTYGLDDAVIQKFHKNVYKDARMLHFITITELKEMDFRLGEIAGLRDAVELWSNALDN